MKWRMQPLVPFVDVSPKRLGLIDNDKFNFLWVVDWPMFEWSEEEGRYMSAHHPFTLPQEETAHELEGDLARSVPLLTISS